MVSKIDEGIWVIRIQKHLQEYVSSPALSDFDATINAGLCGRLMSRLRKMEVINYDKLKVISADLGIMPLQLKNIIVPILETNGFNVYRDGTGSINRIEEDIVSYESILPIVSEIRNSLGTTETENATLESQHICSEFPIQQSELVNSLTSNGYSVTVATNTLELQSSFELLGTVCFSGNENLVYSEYVWGKIIKKGAKWMSKLDQTGRTAVENLLGEVNGFQGIPLDKLGNQDLIDVARRTGIIRVCPVDTLVESKNFVFSPSIGSIFQDDTDEVKTCLACLRYGETYSQISRIKSSLSIINALIDRDTHTVGPATAIGTDYILLEKAGIVKLIPDNTYPERYNMTLLKQDVAERVREILRTGTLSGLSDETTDVENLFNSILSPTSITTPEQDRIRLRKHSPQVKSSEQDFLKAFRDEKY